VRHLEGEQVEPSTRRQLHLDGADRVPLSPARVSATSTAASRWRMARVSRSPPRMAAPAQLHLDALAGERLEYGERVDGEPVVAGDGAQLHHGEGATATSASRHLEPGDGAQLPGERLDALAGVYLEVEVAVHGTIVFER
jgi:hypothetical protein